jgi:hypothetical protein
LIRGNNANFAWLFPFIFLNFVTETFRAAVRSPFAILERHVGPALVGQSNRRFLKWRCESRGGRGEAQLRRGKEAVSTGVSMGVSLVFRPNGRSDHHRGSGRRRSVVTEAEGAADVAADVPVQL